METLGATVSDGKHFRTENADGSAVKMEGFRLRVEEIISKVDRVRSITEMY